MAASSGIAGAAVQVCGGGGRFAVKPKKMPCSRPQIPCSSSREFHCQSPAIPGVRVSVNFDEFLGDQGSYAGRDAFSSSLPAQPFSRGLSDSLPTLTKASRRSRELRHQSVVFLSDLRLENASGRQKGAFSPIPTGHFWGHTRRAASLWRSDVNAPGELPLWL
jgi:hypothetical protein